MKYVGLPMGMWALYRRSFQSHLVSVLGFTEDDASKVSAVAKPRFKAIVDRLPEFEKRDRFKLNIVNCAMFAAFLLSLEKRPDVDMLTDYYAQAMMIRPTRWFCRMSGRKLFTKKGIHGMEETSELKAADRNPYSWNMEYLPYPDGSGYEARFSRCGICTLMNELGLYDLVPAMCHLDYTMCEAGGVAVFVRKYTLASGGPYCDCGYKKK